MRCPELDERTMSSTKASLSTRRFCSATTCHPRLHPEDIRPLQLSSSWPQDLTRCEHVIRITCGTIKKSFLYLNEFFFFFLIQCSMVWTLIHLCHTPTLTSLDPVDRFLVSRQEPLSSPWQPNTSCLGNSKWIAQI